METLSPGLAWLGLGNIKPRPRHRKPLFRIEAGKVSSVAGQWGGHVLFQPKKWKENHVPSSKAKHKMMGKGGKAKHMFD